MRNVKLINLKKIDNDRGNQTLKKIQIKQRLILKDKFNSNLKSKKIERNKNIKNKEIN